MASYSGGVTIKVNGSPVEISAAERQSNHAVVYYTIPAVSQGDTVTWEYTKASGNIVAESGGVALENVIAQAVTNNVSSSGPQFSSAEIGAVNAFTIPVTFNLDVSASDFATGVTIKVNDTATSIASATRQSNHAIVYYVIPVLWHGSGDTVTWEYSATSGNIVAESGATPLGDVSAQSVTNNCEYAALLDLQADTLVLNDGDPISTWADQSGNGNDFTQTGVARPAKQTVGGYPVVRLDGVDDWLLGTSFANNLSSETVISILGNWSGIVASKIGNDWCSDPGCTGWTYWPGAFYLFTDTSNYIYQSISEVTQAIRVYTAEVVSKTELHSYLNGILDDQQADGGSVGGSGVSSYSNSEPVRLFADGLGPGGGCDPATTGDAYCFVFYASAPNGINRAALEVRLAARYGVTL